MSVHIFAVSEDNYEICIKKGLVGLPETSNPNVFDGLISRLAAVRENDYVLMYVLKEKELRGVWQIDGAPFYDESEVWNDKVYPFRCKIKCSKYFFDKPLMLNDINDLRNQGKIWTWALQRATGSNAMFSISDTEFSVLLTEYMKINPFSFNKRYIPEPYPFHIDNVLSHIHTENGALKYEYSVMAHLNHSFCNNNFSEIFGNYTDNLSYVPTNLGREIDILLMYGNQYKPSDVLSYDIIEVKRDVFDEKALSQLIDYESWFLQKKVSGDLNMVRTTAIARRFDESVVDYVNKRTRIEGKPVKLLEYQYDEATGFMLTQIY